MPRMNRTFDKFSERLLAGLCFSGLALLVGYNLGWFGRWAKLAVSIWVLLVAVFVVFSQQRSTMRRNR